MRLSVDVGGERATEGIADVDFPRRNRLNRCVDARQRIGKRHEYARSAE